MDSNASGGTSNAADQKDTPSYGCCQSAVLRHFLFAAISIALLLPVFVFGYPFLSVDGKVTTTTGDRLGEKAFARFAEHTKQVAQWNTVSSFACMAGIVSLVCLFIHKVRPATALLKLLLATGIGFVAGYCALKVWNVFTTDFSPNAIVHWNRFLGDLVGFGGIGLAIGVIWTPFSVKSVTRGLVGGVAGGLLYHTASVLVDFLAVNAATPVLVPEHSLLLKAMWVTIPVVVLAFTMYERPTASPESKTVFASV